MCKLIFYKCDEELVKEITPHIHPHASGENWIASDDLFSIPLKTKDNILIIAPDTVSWKSLQKFQEQKGDIQSSFIGIRKSGTTRRKNGHFRHIFCWPEEKHDLISYLRRNLGEVQDSLKLTVDSFSFPTLILDTASEQMIPNLEFCQLTNLNSEQITRLAGQTSIDGDLPDRELKKVHHFLRQIRRAVGRNQTEIIYQDRDQREYWFQIQISPLEGKQGQKLLVSLHNIDVWKQEQREWQRRWRYQKLIAEVTRLAFQTTSLNDFLHQALDIIGETTQVSRVYVFKNSDDEKFTSNTHEWVNKGIESFKDQLQDVSYENFPYWYRKLSSNQVIYASDIYADLPEELHGILEQQSIKSLLVVPLWLNQRFYGFLGLDECTFNRQWSAEDIELMRSIAHVLELAILNKQIEEENVHILSALQDSERQKAAILRSAPQGIALVRQHKIIYNNPGLERLFGYSTEELKSMMIDELIGPSETFAAQRSKIPTEVPLPQVHREERTFHRKDGTPIH